MAEQRSAGPRGHGDSLEATLRDAEPTLQRLAERLCASHADMLDLLQDTFERAMRQGIPASVRSTRAWLATIMHNLFVDRCRAAARRPGHEVLDEEHGDIVPLEAHAPEPAWSRITIEDIRDALEAIEPSFRDVYISYTFEHRSYEQIAEQLSIQRITVGTRLTRARKKLREVLGKRFGVETTP